MKVISLLQPWASLVVMGHKKIETRSWRTDHRGPLLIHASLGIIGKQFCNLEPFKSFVPVFGKLPRGQIIGLVTLEAIEPTDIYGMASIQDHVGARHWLIESYLGDYGPKRYGWLLSNPIQFKKTIPTSGSLSVWTFPDFNIPDHI